MDELTNDIHRYLVTGPSSNFLDRDVAMLAQWEGANNLLWRVACDGQEAVVKYYLDAGQARGRRQYDGHEQYYRHGIAPQPLWFDRYPTGLSRQVLVYRWAPGKEVEGTDQAQLMQLAQAVAHLHSGDPADVRRFSPNPINLDYLWNVLHGGLPAVTQWLQERDASVMAQLIAALTANAQTLIEASLPLWQGIAPTPVHGDLQLDNVIGNSGNVMLLDWEMYGLGDAAHDVATFLLLSRNLLTEDMQALWLETYLATFAQPGLAERIGIYARILPFHHLLYLLHGLRQSTVEEIAIIHTNQHFLSATLLAAIELSASALQIEHAVDEEEIAKLFWFFAL